MAFTLLLAAPFVKQTGWVYSGRAGASSPGGAASQAFGAGTDSQEMPPNPVLKPRPRLLGPALNLKELNLICWGLFFAFLVLPVCVNLAVLARRGQLEHTFAQVEFVYFYGMGRVFNQYPAEKVYDFEVETRVFSEIHPLKDTAYGAVPYAPFIGVLFRPLARLPYFSAYLLWLAISLSLYLAGLALATARFFPSDPLRRSLIFCLALVFYPFIGWTLPGGGLSTIGFFSMAVALREEDLARPFRSGLALSICTYKPSLALLFVLMLLVARRGRTLFGLAVGVGALALFGTIVEGVRVWPGYIRLLLTYTTSSGGAQTHPFKQVWKYVDLASFSSLFPGGRSWAGQAIFIGFACWAAFRLVQIWWKSAGAPKPAGTMIWAATLTWTLILNTYIPIYDSILVVLSAIATAAVVRGISEKYYRWFTVLWVLILGCSWITVSVAESKGVQILTPLLAALGAVQLAAARRAIRDGGRGPLRDAAPARPA